MANNVCPICGKPTRLYFGNPCKDGLCKECAEQLRTGKIEQCADCGKWHKTAESCECKKQTQIEPIKYDTCIICGSKSYGKPQCRNCYNETKEMIDTLDKNSNVRKLRDYYYNLKERIFIIRSIEETRKQCNKLIAIAMVNQLENEDNSLMERVYADVEKLIKQKKPQEIKNEQIAQEQAEEDKKKSRINTAKDGHVVDSDMEVRIDDALYHLCILHCYGKSISEILEKRKKCDWFIPIKGIGAHQGIYIEYWGREDEEYKQKRREKEELYKKYKIPYISIEKDDPKFDSQGFEDNLSRDIEKLAVEYFGFMPHWK